MNTPPITPPIIIDVFVAPVFSGNGVCLIVGVVVGGCGLGCGELEIVVGDDLMLALKDVTTAEKVFSGSS
jgi:hypothetical protein